MKKNQNRLLTAIVPILILLGWGNSSFASVQQSPDSIYVKLSGTEMTLKQALGELQKGSSYNFVYGGKEINTEIKLKFSATRLLLSHALKEIEKQSPLEFIFNKNQIIVKNRKLEQSYNISGTVSDTETKQGLATASIIIDGSMVGVLTGSTGNYSLDLSPGTYNILFRFVGFKEQVHRINLYSDQLLNVEMEVKENQIQSVDVTGNSNVIENLQIGRTIETLDTKVFQRLNTNDVNDALHGRINGVWNTKVSGAPGDHHKIRIRGISSIFGCTDPLYVVDGAIIPIVNFENLGIADLNAHDIDNITVLKDASSTAMYGNMGSNGVILIETKKGGEGGFNFQVKQGFQRFDNRYDLLKAEEFLDNLQLSDDLIKTQFYTIVLGDYPKYELYPRYRDSLGNTLAEKDYQNEVFKIGRISEYQLSRSGHFKGIDYYLSGNAYLHKGVVVNTNYNKYTFTANFSKVIQDKYSLRFMYKTSRQENKNTLDNYLGNNVILHGINYEPAYVATPDSFFSKPRRLMYNAYDSPTVTMLSNAKLAPDSLFYANNKMKLDIANTFNLQAMYLLNSEMSLKLVTSLSKRNLRYTSINNPYYGLSQQYLSSNEHYIYFNNQLDFNLKKQIGKHQVTGLVRVRNYRDKVFWQVDSINKVNYDGIRPEDEIYLRGSQAIYGEQGSVIRSINSSILNINYQYNNKYSISLITNYERVREGSFLNTGQSYNSIALNYNLAGERWLRLPKWISELNFYINAGESGNYPLNSLSDNLYSASSNYTVRDSVVNAVYISNLANKYITPEKVREINYGAKWSLLNDRIKLSADYYEKTNTDLLIKRTIPLYYGGGFIFQNIGEMKNTGYELGFEAVFLDNRNSYFSTKAGFSTNSQYITHLDDGIPITFNNTDVLIPDFVAKENEVLGAIYGYKYAGYYKDYWDPEYRYNHPDYVENKGAAYVRGDTIISRAIKETDKQIIGNSIPKFTFNWITDFEYKAFSFEMLWYGSIGLDKFNATKASTFMTALNREVMNIVADTMYFLSTAAFYESSYFVEDASFIRLKTLRFSYQQPKKILGNARLEYSLSLENLITLTKYTGYDPEAAIYTDNNFSDNAIDRGAYPNPKGVYFSINMSF